MADKKNIYKNQIMYTSNSRQIRPNNTYHSNLSNRNFKEFAMHPLQYRNNAVHNLKPFLEKQRQPPLHGNATVVTQNNNVSQFNGSSLRQPLANNKPDVSALLNNNLTKMVVNETIIENVLTINSIDRDFSVYKDPYSYTVRFNPTSDTRIKQEYIDNNGDKKFRMITYKGDPSPWVKLDFEKVRYLKLELAVLPTKTYKIESDDASDLTALTNHLVGTNTLADDEEKKLTGVDIKVIHFSRSDAKNYVLEYRNRNNLDSTTVVYRWVNKAGTVTRKKYMKVVDQDLTKVPHILMNIEEINDINEFSTNENTKKAFNTLYPYHTRGNLTNFHSANVDKIYRFSELGHIKKLTINFTDHLGNKLNVSPGLDSDNTTHLNFDSWVLAEPADEIKTDTNGAKYITARSPSLYIRHPYHTDYQNHLLFKLGTIENEIDKKVFH